MTYARDRVDVFRGKDGDWWWRRWTGSRKTAGSLEGYRRKAYCIIQAKRHNPGAVLRIK